MRYRQGDRYLITSFPKDNGLLLDPGYGTGKKKMLSPLYFTEALTNRGSLPCVPVKCFVQKSQDTRPGLSPVLYGPVVRPNRRALDTVSLKGPP